MVTTRRASKAKAQVDSMGLFRVLADAEIGVIADLLPQDAAGRLESTCSGLLRVVRLQRSRLALPSVAASVKGLERCDVVDGWLAALERYPLASYVDGSSVREDVFDILLVGLGAALSAGRFKVLARVGAPPECSDILRYQLEQSFQIETEPSLSDGMRCTATTGRCRCGKLKLARCLSLSHLRICGRAWEAHAPRPQVQCRLCQRRASSNSST